MDISKRRDRKNLYNLLKHIDKEFYGRGKAVVTFYFLDHLITGYDIEDIKRNSKEGLEPEERKAVED